MSEHLDRAVAVVGVGAIMPDAPDAASFWENIKNGRYSITDVDPARWDPGLYYDADPKAPDKTYSKIGGWVRDWNWDPRAWKLPIMPRVADAMDDGQKWALACTQQALSDYGYPDRPLDTDRVAVVFGNALGGEKHYQTVLRISFPELAEELGETPSFRALPNDLQRAITAELRDMVDKRYPEITEDTMPGELANCTAGRVANLFNLRGPNYVVDAACASTMAAMASAVDGLVDGQFDAVVAGGIDRNMGAHSYVKFCKIGALSATGTRPYADGADGFVMGEGAAVFLLKRLDDAVRAGDRIYCVLLGLAGSSDGKGKGITAPNPVGQKLAVQRAWRKAGVAPQTASLVEGHGTSTRVGDVVEHESMAEVFGGTGVAPGSIALGSVKSNIGHLKGAAGAAGIFKTVMALHDKVLPPSLHFDRPNPDIDFDKSPLRVNTELRPWDLPEVGVRRAGVSAFGFGGTNFHAVLEEYVPGSGNGDKKVFAVPEVAWAASVTEPPKVERGAAVVGAADEGELAARLRVLAAEAAEGRVPPPGPPPPEVLQAPERVAIDYGSADELADKASRAVQALAAGEAAWKLLRGRGIYRGRGPAPKVAFLYTGQGSQYPNMLRSLAESDPLVAEIFDEADRVMTPLLDGRRLRDIIFVDADEDALAQAEAELRKTEITQPAVLTVDHALTRLLEERGMRPDFVMGHSLGEYGALVAAGALPFADALEAVSARGREMAELDIEDLGLMAAVLAPLAEVEQILDGIDGNVVIANVNSTSQAVIGGATAAVSRAIDVLTERGHQVVPLPVSHAFHTSIVAPASEPLMQTLARLRLTAPSVPVVTNVTGDFYPMGDGVTGQMIETLGLQVASPVQFVRGLRTLYEHGARVFVEVGPKKALHGFAEDVLGADPDVSVLFTNHPKWGDDVAFNQAVCGLYAAGLGGPRPAEAAAPAALVEPPRPVEGPVAILATPDEAPAVPAEVVAGLVEQTVPAAAEGPGLYRRPVVVTGAALGLPGVEHLFDPSNVERILRGEQCIKAIPAELRDAILDQHITRLVKQPDGSGTFETIDDAADVIKLAGRAQAFDPVAEFGIDANRVHALDRTTCMAIAAGFDALRDAGIPLVMHYRSTSIGTQLPERWGLPDDLRDETGVVFASAFPGFDAFAGYAREYYTDKARREQLAALDAVRASLVAADGSGAAGALTELDRRIAALRAEIEANPYVFDRRFLFRVLSMGHSQFAEIIGARGPNTQVNAACASTTQAVAVAEDWIRTGRCRRVVVVAADDVTSDNLLGWVGAGFLASGAAATDEDVEAAAIPFDRRRHGMILGMGAAALVLEAADAAEERGIRPIAEVLSAFTANSAFHGTRLDVAHISEAMETLVRQAEQRWRVDRQQMAPALVFVSHETYTPARGGSAAAEVTALRSVFGAGAKQIVMANTKGFTGHAMGAGIEDVVAVKSLETGLVPPIANFKEPDPELGELNLSKGGSYPVRYALRLAAGFGSQISMILFAGVPAPDGRRRAPSELGYEYRVDDDARWRSWVARMSGTDAPSLEIVQHQLRVVDVGPARNIAPATAPPTEAPDELEPVDAPALGEPAPAPASSGPAATPEGAALVEAAAQPPPDEAEVRARVLGLVAEKTGYPPDMLDVDLDLEADLGVDTVKQAELFAAVRDAYGIARDDKLKLRDFPTLGHVVGFVLDRAAPFQTPAPAAADFSQAQEAMAAGVTPAEPALQTAPAALVAEPEPAAPPVGVGVDEAEVRAQVLGLVAEKTGYPMDMLDVDLDLEADLGVDTVKQAELFAAVRDAYGIAREDKLKLRDFPTLAHVIGFVLDRAGAAPAPAAAAVAEPAPAAAPVGVGVDEAEVRARVLGLVAEKTGYPMDMLDVDLDLEADLGVDTVKQAELFAAVRDAYGIAREDKLKLRDFPTLAHVIGFVLDRAGAAPAPAAAVVAERVTEPAPAAPVGVGVDEAEVRARVLGLVAEKTGYPMDMLDVDLDLEADLGVDTVKQAELFAAVRDAYGIAREDKLKLRDFPTLAHVIGFVLDRAGAAPAPAAAVVTEPAPAAAPVGVGVDEAEVRARVLGLVAEKTGYPMDMLDVELDLEADLGVDTVKQAELFAAVRDAYGIAREDKLKLRDFPTLAHVIGFVLDRAGAAPAPAAAVVTEPAPAAAPVGVGVDEAEVRARVLGLVAEKTGYPMDMLDVELDLEADLGVDTVKQAELFAAVRDAYGIAREDKLKLRDFPTLAHVIGFVLDRAGAAPAPAAAVVAERVTEPAPAAPVGVGVDEAEVRAQVLGLVAEKTGYPMDMLDVELDLEADLGVDTVKQAELFAAVREAYGIAREDKLKLRDFPTLAHVIGFVLDRAGGAPPSPAPAVTEPAREPDAAPETEPVEIAAAEPAPFLAETAAAPVGVGVDEAEVRVQVLGLVAEKTGYPMDMLDVELDLEADLGVDTVKQAELFASVREAYGIAREDKLKLRDFPTLAHVIGFVLDRAGAATPVPAVTEPAGEPVPVEQGARVVAAPRPEATAGLDDCDAITRRVPVPVLRPPLEWCRSTGVRLGAGSRVVVMPDRDGVAEVLVSRLHADGVDVLVIDSTPDARTLASQLDTWAAAGDVSGVFWLPALDVEPALAELDLATWREGLRVRVKLLAASMRALYERIAGPGTFLLAATRMGGFHGYHELGARAPMGGAVTGFAKAYKREHPDCLVKALDVETGARPDDLAAALLEEVRLDPGVVEVARHDGLRWAIGLKAEVVSDGGPGLTLSPDSVFVVTGAAGSIVSAIVADFAAASGGTFHLLDLAPEPDASDPDLALFATDKEALKRELFQRIKDRGERATPALVERELAALERRRAALDAILAVRETGGAAHYHRLDLRDGSAVAQAIDEVRARHGRIDVLLHAAGLEISRFLPDKSDDEYELVFDVKSDGWFNLLSAIGTMPLRATVCFSSVAGRFGNGGQTDYSAANDLLCKTTASFRSTRPGTRGIVIDWTAWGGIGMATRGSIPTMMAMAGIDMLAPEVGIPWVRRELVSGGRRGEVLVAGALGILGEEPDPDHGLDRAAADGRRRGPVAGQITGMGVFQPLTVETTLDPSVQPFLDHHRIDGVPVLPGVMGVEAFAASAVLATPGWQVQSIEDVAFLAPFKFYRDEPRSVIVESTITPHRDGALLAECRLVGSRLLPNQADPQVTVHFTGRVRLARGSAPAPETVPVPGIEGAAAEAEAIYAIYFHGPAYQVLERSWREGDRRIGLMATDLPPNHQPPELPLATAPRLLELCFQTAGVWELAETGRLALPRSIGRVSIPERDEVRGRLLALVEPHGDRFDAVVVDETGQVHLRMEDYATVALPAPVEESLLEPLRVARP